MVLSNWLERFSGHVLGYRFCHPCGVHPNQFLWLIIFDNSYRNTVYIELDYNYRFIFLPPNNRYRHVFSGCLFRCFPHRFPRYFRQFDFFLDSWDAKGLRPSDEMKKQIADSRGKASHWTCKKWADYHQNYVT